MVKRTSTGPCAFTAIVEAMKLGVPFYAVTLPARASAAMGSGRVNVSGTVNGVEIKTSLLPVSTGGHKLLLRGSLREAAGVAPGDRVKVVIERVLEAHEEPMPADLAAALREVDALESFQRIARSTRNELIRWIDDAKMETTREKRIGNAVERGLAARDKQADREAKSRPRGKS